MKIWWRVESFRTISFLTWCSCHFGMGGSWCDSHVLKKRKKEKNEQVWSRVFTEPAFLIPLKLLPPQPFQFLNPQPMAEGRARAHLPVSGSFQPWQSLFHTPLTPWHPWPVCPFRRLLCLLTEDVDLLFPISQTSGGLWVPWPDTGSQASWKRSGPRSLSQWVLQRQDTHSHPTHGPLDRQTALFTLFFTWQPEISLCICWTHLDDPVFPSLVFRGYEWCPQTCSEQTTHRHVVLRRVFPKPNSCVAVGGHWRREWGTHTWPNPTSPC